MADFIYKNYHEKNSLEDIAEISAYCGFGQQSYYNRLFLREYGMTPKAFREK